jgi:hypothetical protein
MSEIHNPPHDAFHSTRLHLLAAVLEEAARSHGGVVEREFENPPFTRRSEEDQALSAICIEFLTLEVQHNQAARAPADRRALRCCRIMSRMKRFSLRKLGADRRSMIGLLSKKFPKGAL